MECKLNDSGHASLGLHIHDEIERNGGGKWGNGGAPYKCICI